MAGTDAYLTYLLFFLSISYHSAHAVDSTCRFTSVVFRHGDRSPMRAVPTDLYTEAAWPQGYAQLTKRGVQQAYELGQFLRSWYDGFLSQRYERNEVYVESTDTGRTLMSAQAVLSSLYVPAGAQVWLSGLPWQPVPTHPATWRKLASDCREDVVKEAKAKMSEEFRTRYKDVFEELDNGLGMHLHSMGIWTIYDTFKCERNYNMTWPSWMSERLFNQMGEILPLHHQAAFSLSPDRADLLSKMIQDMASFMHGGMNVDRKAHIYSGHDTTLLCLLCAMDVYNLRMTPYSAAVMVELHYGNWTNETHTQRPENGDLNDDFNDNLMPWPQSAPDEYDSYATDYYYSKTEATNSTENENGTTTMEASATTAAPTMSTGSPSTTNTTREFTPRWFVQVWLRNETGREPYKLTLPGCTADCPWEKFVELTLSAVNDLHLNVTMCRTGMKKPPQYNRLWRVIFVTVGTGGVVMLAVVVFSAICLCQHRKRRQRLQAIYRQLNTEDIPMADTS